MNTDIESGCILPVMQSAVTGILLGVLALAGCLYWDLPKAGVIALAAGAGGAVLMWVSGLTTWRRSQFDDVYYSPPPPPALPQVQSVKVELRQPLDGGQQTQLVDLPANRDQLKELADGIMRGAPFSETTWSGPGRPFTRAQFADLRASMMRKGWLEWRRFDSPGQGCKLTAPGKAVMRSFSSDTARSPLLTQDPDIYQ